MVAQKNGLKTKEVKLCIETLIEVAAAELKSDGKFYLGGAFNVAVTKKPARAAKEGMKAKPASTSLKIVITKKFKEMIRDD